MKGQHQKQQDTETRPFHAPHLQSSELGIEHNITLGMGPQASNGPRLFFNSQVDAVRTQDQTMAEYKNEKQTQN